ncbi:hypothetical protein SAMN05443633_103232 [Chryseobacterium arachidis]|uniref:Uncharacterized protein n=1 Tax=Chryseobacterium arachidis TaxID=1416778 RepID=A0A1M4ZQ28_9FLAO|nr:hypothetical protein [Chryseobacterium arachidis]SHF20143.1 hypothetical protein SAMN05443633_103232 [Chryseobacterium arachidis]
MKKKFLFFLLISGLIFSQQKNITIKNLSPKTESFAFPQVSYPQNPRIENKINTFLQVDQLEHIPGAGGSTSQAASSGKTFYSKYSYFYWEKMESPKNILSIAMDGEFSGANPEDFSIWRNFDLRTGNLINVKDLFQPNAVKTIEDLIQKSIKKEISDFLAQLKAEKNPTQEILDQIALYEGCYTHHTLGGVGYYFAENKIRFIAGRCANRAKRQLDELDYYVIEFPYQELEKYWSPYAKNLLSDSDKIDATSLSHKLYKGTIDGKYPITVLIGDVYGEGELSVSAKYWYDHKKKLIEWHGNLKGNHLSLLESDYYSEETRMWILKAAIEADLKGNKITGSWQDEKTKKYLKLELEEL